MRSAALLLPPHVVGAPFAYENPLRAFEDRDFDEAVIEAARLYGAQPFLSEEAYHQALAAGQFLPEDIQSILSMEPNKEICAGGLDRRSLRRAMLTQAPRLFDARTIQWIIKETDLLLRFRTDSVLRNRLAPASKGSRAEGVEVKALFDAVAGRVPESTTEVHEYARPRDGVLAATGVDLDDIVVPFFVYLLRSFTGIGQRWPMREREQGFLAATRLWIADEKPDSFPAELKSLAGLFEAQAAEKDDSLGVAVHCIEALGVPLGQWNDFVRRKLLALRGWASLFAYLEQFAETPGASSAPKHRLIDFLAVYLTVTVAAVKSVTPNPSDWRFMKSRGKGVSRARLVTIAEIFDVAQIIGLSSSDIRSLPDDEFGRLRTEIAAFGEFERRRLLKLAYGRGRKRQMLRSLMLASRADVPSEKQQLARIVFCADDKQSLLRLRLAERCRSLQTHGVPSFLKPTSPITAEMRNEDKVDAVSRLIALIGLASNSASLVVLVGHANIPENLAPDWSSHCGVCEGGCDAEHARRLADWANDSKVRVGLQLRGITLSADTWFLAASHSRVQSKIEILERERVPELHAGTLSKVEALLGAVASGGRTGQPSRSGLGRWPLAGKVLERAAAVFEKPSATDLASSRATGHPGCALCLIGFDHASKALPDHGAFMASYDAAADTDGHVLASLLEELVPACAEVNLDYFFARVDNDQYGVSVKHSTESGEMKGPIGDLRAGLPWGAVEEHEPLRLLVIVRAPPEVVRQALHESPHSMALVTKKWVRLTCMHEEKIYAFRRDAVESPDGSWVLVGDPSSPDDAVPRVG